MPFTSAYPSCHFPFCRVAGLIFPGGKVFAVKEDDGISWTPSWGTRIDNGRFAGIRSKNCCCAEQE